MQLSDWLTLAAVIVALGLGIWANVQTMNLDKKEKQRAVRNRKEQQLYEIKSWLSEVLVCHLPILPTEVLLDRKKEQIEIIRKYITQMNAARMISRSEIISSIISQSFKDSLSTEFNSVVDNLVAMTFLEMGVKSGFHGDFLKIIENAEQRLKNGEDKTKLLEEYAIKEAESVKAFSDKISTVISSL